jgi:hypothetical protein
MVVFEKASPENTVPAIKIAIKKASEIGADIVVATTKGTSAQALIKLAKEEGFTGRVVVVTHVWGMKKSGENEITPEIMKEISDSGAVIVTAAHALSGVERALSGKFGGVYPVEIIAHTLRMFSQGVKVCVEISAMAIDAGAVAVAPVVALGGTGLGLDTACVLTPGYSAKIFDTKIHEVLCMPY